MFEKVIFKLTNDAKGNMKTFHFTKDFFFSRMSSSNNFGSFIFKEKLFISEYNHAFK